MLNLNETKTEFYDLQEPDIDWECALDSKEPLPERGVTVPDCS